jgi:Uma2 family endonuclease
LGAGLHSSIKTNCGASVLNHVDTLDHGTVAAGFHCRLTVNGRIRFRQPDICVSFDPQIRAANDLEGAPEFVIEIRSPDDTIRFLGLGPPEKVPIIRFGASWVAD